MALPREMRSHSVLCGIISRGEPYISCPGRVLLGKQQVLSKNNFSVKLSFIRLRVAITVSVCVVADFGALRYQPEMVLMRAINLDI